MEQKMIVEAKGLVKRYADHLVLNGIHFEVFQGECFGILGPHGAGKSTLMQMMYGSSPMQLGELFIVGLNARSNIREIKSRIGVLPQDEGLDADFTVRENLKIYGSFYGIDRDALTQRTEDLLKLMRLEDLGDQVVRHLSGSMKRRLGLARAMINQPEVLFLDEPSSGLDPQGRIWVWDFLKKVKTEMGTVVLTTSYMEEAEQICDRIAIMDRGQLLAIGNPKTLIRENVGVQVVEFQVAPSDLQYYLTRLSSHKFRHQVIRDQVNVHLQAQEEVQVVMGLVQSLKVTIRQPSLSDVFLKLAGYKLRDELL
jgi:lipooligosaccharide transport system ATP-binding protein